MLGNVTPLLADERVRGGVAAFIDITARKEAEESLREADRRKDEFLAMLSHELRNPLAPLRTAIEIMRASKDSGAKTALVDLLDRQAQQLTRLTDDLLEVSRFVAGQIVLRKEIVDLRRIVSQGIENVSSFIERRGQTMRVEGLTEPIMLHVDALRVAQVITNLLHNAAKYTPPHGAIVLSCTTQPTFVEVAVCDSGRGIDAELLPRLFNLFVQGEQGLARADGGLGVGLALAKRLVELHGGTINAASQGRNKGSEFRFTLPLPPRAALSERNAGSAKNRSVSTRRGVLVVDDNHDAADSVAEFLRMEGYEVEARYEGYGVEQKVSDFKPDAVILDIGLPEIDGYEIARRLRRSASLAEPLALISTHGLRPSGRYCQGQGRGL